MLKGYARLSSTESRRRNKKLTEPDRNKNALKLKISDWNSSAKRRNVKK
jgi:hypothetical protein